MYLFQYFCFISALPFAFSVIQNCVVGEWASWNKCDSKCDVGKQIRTRPILIKPNNFFSRKCPNLNDTRNCGIENNGCDKVCEKSTGYCLCFSGYTLGSDRKSCVDVNECAPNNKKGPCSYYCSNLDGGYQCSCPTGLYLQEDGHACGKSSPRQEICTPGIHTYDENKKCVCVNKLTGWDCDRDETRCGSCHKDELCLTFVKSTKICVEVETHVSILLHISSQLYVTGNYRYSVEKYVKKVLESDTTKNLHSYTRAKRAVTSSYYVETLEALKVFNNYTLATFAVLDVGNNYMEYKSSKICKLLKGSDIECVSEKDCVILTKAGIDCPRLYNPVVVYKASKESKIKPWIYGVIVCIIITLLIVSIALYIYFRKRRKHVLLNVQYSQTHRPLISSEGGDQNITESDCTNNILYGCEDTDSPPLYESIDNLKSKCLEEDQYVEVKKDIGEASNAFPPGYDVPKTKTDLLEGNSKNRLVVDISNEDEPRYASPPTLSRSSGDC